MPNGTVEIDYYQPFLQLVKTNKLVSFINSFNKLTVKGDCLQQVNSFISLQFKDT